MFEAMTIQRMELLVLSTLKWRMQAVTPFSYIDYFLHELNGGNAPSRSAVRRSAELILRISRGARCKTANVQQFFVFQIFLPCQKTHRSSG